MKIVLNADEINEALTEYVSGMGVDVTGKDLSVDFNAGRGGNSYSATVDITKAVKKPKKVNKPTPIKEPTPEPEIAEAGAPAPVAEEAPAEKTEERNLFG